MPQRAARIGQMGGLKKELAEGLRQYIRIERTAAMAMVDDVVDPRDRLKAIRVRFHPVHSHRRVVGRGRHRARAARASRASPPALALPEP